MKHSLFTLANKVLQRLGYRAIRYPKSLQADPSRSFGLSLLHELALMHMWRSNQPFRFIQVGALEMNGHFNLVDAARRFDNYRGVLIDAQPLAIQRLTSRYRDDPFITVLHRAVTNASGEVVFYSVDNDDKTLPAWVEALASLSRDNIRKFERDAPGISARIIETRVLATSLAEVVGAYFAGELDLLMIDAEGHDLQILCTFPFNEMKPAVVFLEHRHLNAEDREEAIRILISHGYRVACLEHDLLASRQACHATD